MGAVKTSQRDGLSAPASLWGCARDQSLCGCRDMLDAFCGGLWSVKEMQELDIDPVKQVLYWAWHSVHTFHKQNY